MPPKPTIPTEDLNALHENGKRLESQVRSLLQQRAFGQAAKVFDNEWEHTVLANLPLRVSFVLTRLDRRGVRRFLDLCQAEDRDGAPKLTLRVGVDPRRPESTGVLIDGEEEILGFLSAEAEGVLERAAHYASEYAVKPLAITGIEAGQLSFEMELARPDLKQCTACGQLHSGPKEKCEPCREEKRRKKRGAEPVEEQAAVPLARTFRDLSRAEQSL